MIIVWEQVHIKSANYYLCLDTDECAIKTDNCSLHAMCNNYEGSFNCSCKSGFFGDGISCTGNYKTLLSISSVRHIL